MSAAPPSPQVIPETTVNGQRGKARRILLSLAGVALLAGLATRALALGTLATGTQAAPHVTVVGWVWYALYYFAQLNLVLMFFNLIPMPPLDGSRVLPLFLSDAALAKYHQFERYGILVFFVVVLLLPDYLGIDPLGWYFDVTVAPLLKLFTGV